MTSTYHPRSIDAESLRDSTPLLIRLPGYHRQMGFEPVLNEPQRIEPPQIATK